jgi:type IV pilus assembly protein PilQ
VLGDIPYLGNLFKSKSVSSKKRELLIFVTPKILKDSLSTQR